MVEKTSSSIRAEFLISLILVGATTVSTYPFLAEANVVVVILLPIQFLVIIPFLSSRIIKFIAKVRGRKRRGDQFTP